MLAIKVECMKHMPSDCDSCHWFSTRPHPYKGWTDICELMGHCMDDDQPEEWIYSGDERPKACPLVEVVDYKEEIQMGKVIGCSKCVNRFWCTDRDMPHAVHCNNYGKSEDEQTEYGKGLQQLFADILFDKEKSEQFLKECKAMGIEP